MGHQLATIFDMIYFVVGLGQPKPLGFGLNNVLCPCHLINGLGLNFITTGTFPSSTIRSPCGTWLDECSPICTFVDVTWDLKNIYMYIVKNLYC